MFDNLSKRLTSAIKKLVRSSSVDEQLVESVLNEIKLSLLEADVSVNLASELVEKIKKKALKEKPPAGLTLREHVIKAIYEQLVEFLGKEFVPLKGKKIMLVGLFGSGKTTTAAKLGYYLKKRGEKVALVCLDYHRPGAPEQLEQLAKQIGVKFLLGKDAYEVAKESLEKFSNYTLIFDTAGRNALDAELAKELKKLGEIIKPDEVLLVLPADIGKVAGTQAKEFNKLVGITGIIVTKLDATGKAGGALAAAAATGAKVKFIGIGEKVKDLEAYDPTRFVSRMLGLGDLQTLLEKAKEAIKPERAEKIAGGKFTLEDFIDQLEAMKGMGPLQQIASMIPGLGSMVPKEVLKQQEKIMKKWKYIVQSMTPKERENPEIINESRIKRIAKGSGTEEAEVRQLLQQYRRIKKVMRQLGGIKGLKRGQLKQLMKQFGFKI